MRKEIKQLFGPITRERVPSGSVQSVIGKRSLTRFRLPFVLLGSLLLTACSSVQTSSFPRENPTRDIFDMVEAGLTYIDRMHVRAIPLDQVALAGLSQLKEVDPRAQFGLGSDGIVVSAGGFAREYAVANSQDPTAWANATVAAYEGLRAQSPAVDRLETKKLYELLYEGYSSRLDRFSRYLQPAEVSRQDDRFLGFGGLGVTISHETDGIRIETVNRDAPAMKAGLKRGDLINGVNRQFFAATESEDERVRQLKGPIGSRVRVEFLRGGQQLATVVVRDEIVPESVEMSLKDGIAHIEIFTFNRETAQRVEESLFQAQADARSAGTELAGVVLDVRGNGGGLRSAVVDVADLFLSNRLITRTRGRTNRANRDFKSVRPDISRGLPLAVLLNEGSASASELLAAGLQDNGRALVIGSTSFGKGSVQSKLPLPNDGELALTTAEFFGPSGAPLHEYGVIPTICTSDNLASASQVVNAIRTGSQRIAAAEARRILLANNRINRDSYRRTCPPSEAMPNRDLAIATAILKDQGAYSRVLQNYAEFAAR